MYFIQIYTFYIIYICMIAPKWWRKRSISGRHLVWLTADKLLWLLRQGVTLITFFFVQNVFVRTVLAWGPLCLCCPGCGGADWILILHQNNKHRKCNSWFQGLQIKNKFHNDRSILLLKHSHANYYSVSQFFSRSAFLSPSSAFFRLPCDCCWPRRVQRPVLGKQDLCLWR